jgi:hypothetical protein
MPPRLSSSRRSPRDHVLETLAPRRSDRIADRLRVLAAVLRSRGTVLEDEARALDGDALEAMANAQREAEEELSARFVAFYEYYATYRALLDERRNILQRGIEVLSAAHRDPEARRALRLCRLHRPPVATVRAMVERLERTERRERLAGAPRVG